jgi:hypothetical protein
MAGLLGRVVVRFRRHAHANRPYHPPFEGSVARCFANGAAFSSNGERWGSKGLPGPLPVAYGRTEKEGRALTFGRAEFGTVAMADTIIHITPLTLLLGQPFEACHRRRKIAV